MVRKGFPESSEREGNTFDEGGRIIVKQSLLGSRESVKVSDAPMMDSASFTPHHIPLHFSLPVRTDHHV